MADYNGILAGPRLLRQGILCGWREREFFNCKFCKNKFLSSLKTEKMFCKGENFKDTF